MAWRNSKQPAPIPIPRIDITDQQRSCRQAELDFQLELSDELGVAGAPAALSSADPAPETAQHWRALTAR